MILQIDNLVIPPTLSGNAETFNADSSRRTVGGRLITKTSSFEKWRATLNYEGRSIPLDLQRSLYVKCREMRSVSRPVVLVSPYNGQIYTIDMKCTQPLPPKVTMHINGNPLFYTNIGAVFEEV